MRIKSEAKNSGRTKNSGHIKSSGRTKSSDRTKNSGHTKNSAQTKNNRRTKSQGFTLAELLITLAIMTILIVSSALLLATTFQYYQHGRDFAVVSEPVRVAQARIARELPEALRDSITLAATTLSFKRFQDPNVLITYDYDAGTQQLTRQEDAEPQQILAEHVSAVAFAGFDKNFASTAVLADLFAIGATIESTQGSASVSQEMIYRLRNRP